MLLPASNAVIVKLNAVFAVAVDGAETEKCVAAPGVLVSEKFTVVKPDAAAVTVYGPPAVAFAVKGAAAIPDAFVGTVIATWLLLNRPDAPVPGAVNVTLTPDTGLLPASFTVTANGFVKAVLMVADCGLVPALAVI
jgi:hypothetical protein